MAAKTRPGRNRARRCAMQATYQGLMTGQTYTEISRQFHQLGYLDGADQDYFDGLLQEIHRRRDDLDELIDRFADRPRDQINPVEHATLLVALAELAARIDVPYRVVIDEAIKMSRRYGSNDAHRYINAVVDRAAKELRAPEYGRPRP